MAVQLDYVAKKGWRPRKSDFIITLLKVQLSESALKEAKKHKIPKQKLFESAAATVAAESSTGTWTNVYDGPGSGMNRAAKYRALAFDLDYKNHMFKVAYPLELFEKDNISGLLAGIVGNIAGMKMVAAMRVYDVLFPPKMVRAFVGPKFGVAGIRKMLNKPKGPLVITVPKPKIGRSDAEQAALAEMLFTAGDGTYDGIKDDENLTSLSFNHFTTRTRKILHEAKRAHHRTGNKKFYLANITHSNIATMFDRAKCIKDNEGIFMMMDVVTTGFTGVDSVRRADLGLAIHAHRAMHGFITRDNSPGVHGKGDLHGFSISMVFLAKLFRLLGVDSLHGGSPLAKMEDYGEAVYIRHVLQDRITKPDTKIPSLGQNWEHIKPVWMTASGGLHPGDFEFVMHELGEDIILQCGGGLLGHPDGVVAGVEAVEQARDAVMKGVPLKHYVDMRPYSALARAVEKWGYGPRIVY